MTAAEPDGAALLDELRRAVQRYVVLPSAQVADAVTLWVAATHAQPAWAHAPRLVIRAPQKRCGKSRLLDVIEATCHEPLITVNASPAAVYRSITADPPTLLVDEADAIFGTRKAAEQNEDLRALLNAGHQRNRPARRYDATARKVESLPTFAMAALAGIGMMPDTIEDRAVIVKMRRRAPGEQVSQYRHRRDRPSLAALGERLHEWIRPHMDRLEEAEPDLPIEDRAADNWEPLVAVADLAGADWPARARKAAEVLSADQDDTGPVPLSIRLLTDCRAAFGTEPVLSTEGLLTKLRADAEAPWASYGPTGLTAMKLGNMLRDYGVGSANIRFPDGNQRKGYQRTDFADAWRRYCPADDRPTGNPAPPASQPSQGHLPWSGRDGSPDWDGSSRPTEPSRPASTSGNDAGTAGTQQGLRTDRHPRCTDCRSLLAPEYVAKGWTRHPYCDATG